MLIPSDYKDLLRLLNTKRGVDKIDAKNLKYALKDERKRRK